MTSSGIHLPESQGGCLLNLWLCDFRHVFWEPLFGSGTSSHLQWTVSCASTRNSQARFNFRNFLKYSSLHFHLFSLIWLQANQGCLRTRRGSAKGSQVFQPLAPDHTLHASLTGSYPFCKKVDGVWVHDNRQFSYSGYVAFVALILVLTE